MHADQTVPAAAGAGQAAPPAGAGCAGKQAAPVRDDPAVTALVTRAAHGEAPAWDALVERYAPLIWSICREHRLADADAGDAGRRVWRQLADHLDQVRDPAALPGWLAAATRRECARGTHAAAHPPGTGTGPGQHARADAPPLPAADRHAALRAAFARLPPSCQQLITLLSQDPPPSDATISAALNIPAGSIGPHRRRCLDTLRRDPALTALTSAATEHPGHELPGTRPRTHDQQPMAP